MDMREPIRSARLRVSLHAEQLEDRSVMSAVVPEFVSTSAYASAGSVAGLCEAGLPEPGSQTPATRPGSQTPATKTPARVLVAVTPGTSVATKFAPYAQHVAPLGFDIYSVDLSANANVDAVAAFYAAQPDVVSAAPDRIVKLNRTFNDPSLSAQSGLVNIDAATAWNRQTGTRNTIVAVIDTGVDYRHSDLAANIWVNTGEIAGNGLDDDHDGYIDDVYGYDFANNRGDPIDTDSHGTHIAGIIGAVGNNGIGISGVNPNTRIMPLKFIGDDGTGFTSNAVRALDYAVSHGAKVANASWGGGDIDSTLSAAIARAGAAGLIFVAAAGNDGSNNDVRPFYPGSYIASLPNIVTVAASDSSDTLASFSNIGANTVTLSAPGVSILSTLPNNRYGVLTGTSISTPFVTGAISLIWDQNPSWTYQQVLAKLRSSVDPIASMAGKTTTGGRLNVAKALDAIAVSPPPVVVPPPATVPPPVVVPPAPPPPVVPVLVSGPQVISSLFSGSVPSSYDRVRFTFNTRINAATITPSDASLTGPGGAIPIRAITPVAGTNDTQFEATFDAQTTPGSYTFAIGPDLFDMAAHRMDQNRNGINGEPADRYSTSETLGASATATTFTTTAANLPVAIPDLGSASIPIVVARDATIGDLDVRLNLFHTFMGDVRVELHGPAGQVATLVNRRGAGGQGYRETIFDDRATTAIEKGTAPFAGSFRPESALSVFHGTNARGTWTLKVTDNDASDSGSLIGVSLLFTTSVTTMVRTPAFANSPIPVTVSTAALTDFQLMVADFLARLEATNERHIGTRVAAVGHAARVW